MSDRLPDAALVREPPRPATREDAFQETLLRRLESRCAMVQLLERSAEGAWRERRRSGIATPGARPSPPRAGLEPLLDWVAPADAARLASALDQVALLNRPWRGAMQTHPGDGRRVEVEIHAEPAARAGTVLLSIVARDIAPQESPAASPAQAFRERFEIVESAVELGIIEYDARARWVRLDEAAAALHGVAAPGSASMALDAWTAMLVPEDQPQALRLFLSKPPLGETERLTVRLPLPDARRPRLIELSMRAAPGQRLVGACRDVTRERSVEELRRQKLAAERASQAKSEFMSQVSHELRTPLNAILGFAQLIAMDQAHVIDAAHRARLEMIQHSGRRLLGLIDQLLQISKIERGRKALRAKSVNVRAVVRRAVHALEIAAAERGLEISVDVQRPELSAVRADPDAFEQVITNLLSNAIKYNRDQGSVRIVFRADEVGELSIEDTGRGMSPSQLGRMFEPFDRLDAEKSSIPGTGLGLVITKHLVEAMDGRLDVQSIVGEGSRFTVQLPLARGSRDMGAMTLPLELTSQWDTDTEYSVLYIEDDEVNVVLMEQLFATQPAWHLHCAATGGEGLVIAVRERPHLILLDMNLPDLQGTEVFKRLRADPRTRDIPCVAVSADAMPAHINRVHALGFEDYWTKPLDLPATIVKLKRLLL